MGYRFKRKEPVEAGLRRIAREQIAKARKELEHRDEDLHYAIHQVRKRCKKIRGLLRLARPGLGKNYQKENRRWRDAAVGLSFLRDAQSVIETLEKLEGQYDGPTVRAGVDSVKAELETRRKAAAEDPERGEEAIKAFFQTLDEGEAALKEWKLKGSGFAPLGAGEAKTFRRGGKAMKAADRESTAENFHEWRKRVKYHGYHLRLLENAWKPVVRTRRKELEKLADMLGEEHDLSILRELLLEEEERFPDPEGVRLVLGLVRRRRKVLRRNARNLGRKIYGEPAKANRKRLESYWNAWKNPKE